MTRWTERAYWIKRIHECFWYNEITGDIYWKIFGGRRTPNKPAGYLSGNGYRYIQLDNEVFKTSHIIWALKKNTLPVKVIDHIDRNPLNERWNNLREVSQADNIRNGKIRKDNNTGHKGITQLQPDKFKARKNGRQIGTFKTLEEAVKAYHASSM